MNCLWCHAAFVEKVSWRYVFGKTTSLQLCEQCHDRLVEVNGDICEKCGRPFSYLDVQYRHGDLCHDCLRWGETALVKNRSVYIYNEFLQEVIAKWKYRGDAELVKLFWPSLQKLARKFEGVDVVVPIPLNTERMYERSFNQAKALAQGLSYPLMEVLVRPDEAAKQSKKSRVERLHQGERFQVVQPHQLHGKHVLLIDDIYTTGATLHAAANVLKQHRAATISAITVARG